MLTVEWRGGAVRMTGPTQSVYAGEIDLDALAAA
jgi:hypothetical protein